MTYVPTTYTEADAALDMVTQEITGLRNAVKTATDRIANAVSQMNAITQPAPTGWADLVGYVNDEAAANPSDPAWQAIKARMDKIVIDAIVIKAQFEAIAAAIASV